MQQQLELTTSHVTDLQRRLEHLQDEAESTRSKLQTQVGSLSTMDYLANITARVASRSKLVITVHIYLYVTV